MSEKFGVVMAVLFWLAVLFGAPVYSWISENTKATQSSVDANQTTERTSYPTVDYDSTDEDYTPDYYDTDPIEDYSTSSDEFENYEYNESYNAATDLDCADVGYRHYVGSNDPNGLDGDGDGWACESY